MALRDRAGLPVLPDDVIKTSEIEGKCLPDTALQDTTGLLARGGLRKSDAGGRSTRYELNDAPNEHERRGKKKSPKSLIT